MRRKLLWYSVLLLPAFLLVGCQNEIDGQGPEAGSPTTFTATIEGGDATKTTLGTPDALGVRPVLWSAGDSLRIGGAIYKLSSGENTGTATFTGGGATTTTISGTDYYEAFYPVSIYNGGSPKLPDTQTYSATRIDNLPMYARSETTNLDFKNLCAVLELKLTGTETVGSITLESTEGKKLSGLFDVVADGTTGYKAQMKSGAAMDAEKKVTLSCGTNGVQLSSTEKSFFIAVPAQSYTSGTLRVTVKDLSGNEITSFTNSKGSFDAVRSKIYEVGKSSSTSTTDFLFSVGINKKVYFSQGNLQYEWGSGDAAIVDALAAGLQPMQDAAGKWYFADPEWEVLSVYGYEQGNGYFYHDYFPGFLAMNNGTAIPGVTRIDHFRWGTSGKNYGARLYWPWADGWPDGHPLYDPYSPPTVYYDYGPAWSSDGLSHLTGDADWGANTIENGAIKNGAEERKNGWRTLNNYVASSMLIDGKYVYPTEWNYLASFRPDAMWLRGTGSIVDDDGTTLLGQGYIFLPDDWRSKNLDPCVNLSSVLDGGVFASMGALQAAYSDTVGIYVTDNIYKKSDWKKMQAAGAIFLPATEKNYYGEYTSGVYTGNTAHKITGGQYEKAWVIYNLKIYKRWPIAYLMNAWDGSPIVAYGGHPALLANRLVLDADYVAPTFTVTLPATLEVRVGATGSLTATVLDGDGKTLPASVTWNTGSLITARASFAQGLGNVGSVAGVDAGAAGTITASVTIGGVTVTSNACTVSVVVDNGTTNPYTTGGNSGF